jgi:prepilin-type N-terminal cleavage/methylation domain-containing protein
MSKKRRNLQSGMTFIEVLVSIFMIGALIVLYASLFNLTHYTKRMKNENIAYHVASKKMEELRAVPYASLPASAAFADAQLAQLPSSSADFTVGNYSTYTGVKELVVTVNWNDGRARTIQLRSLAGSGGINP